VPATLEALLADRLDQLDEGGRLVVPWLAAFGRSVPAALLAEVTGAQAATLATALEGLERRGIVRAIDDAWDFAHDLVRRVAYERTSAPRRRILHRELGRALARSPDPEAAWAGDVARHASLGDDAELCARASVRAGERCLRLFAYGSAEAFSVLGRRHLAGLPGATRLPLEVQLLAVVIHPGLHLRSPNEAGTELARVAAEADELGLHETHSRALVLLARLHTHAWADAPRARAALSQAVTLVERDPVGNLEALLSGARCLALLHVDMPRVSALFASLEPLGARVVDSLYFQWGVGLVRHWEGDDAAGRASLRRAMEHAKRRADHWAEMECGAALATLELDAGDDAAALAVARELRGVAARLGDGGSEKPWAAALEALARGDLDAAADAAVELERLDATGLLAYVRATASRRALARGDVTRAHDLAASAVAAARRTGQPMELALAHVALGLVAQAEGRASDAAAAFATVKRLGVDAPASARGIVVCPAEPR
jgi:hypothetical protein